MKSDSCLSFISRHARGTRRRSTLLYFTCGNSITREPCHVAVHLSELPNTKISRVSKTHGVAAVLGMLPPLFDGTDEFVEDDEATNKTSSSGNKSDKVIFDANDWIEISKPENYVPYSNKLRQSRLKRASGSDSKALGKERETVLFLLLLLFVPIFSLELFFALSRQFICGNFLTQIHDEMWLTDFDRALSSLKGVSPWATYLCSPHLDPLN